MSVSISLTSKRKMESEKNPTQPKLKPTF